MSSLSLTHQLSDLLYLFCFGQETFLKRHRLPVNLVLQGLFFTLEAFDFVLCLDKCLLQPGSKQGRASQKSLGITELSLTKVASVSYQSTNVKWSGYLEINGAEQRRERSFFISWSEIVTLNKHFLRFLKFPHLHGRTKQNFKVLFCDVDKIAGKKKRINILFTHLWAVLRFCSYASPQRAASSARLPEMRGNQASR